MNSHCLVYLQLTMNKQHHPMYSWFKKIVNKHMSINSDCLLNQIRNTCCISYTMSLDDFSCHSGCFGEFLKFCRRFNYITNDEYDGIRYKEYHDSNLLIVNLYNVRCPKLNKWSDKIIQKHLSTNHECLLQKIRDNTIEYYIMSLDDFSSYPEHFSDFLNFARRNLYITADEFDGIRYTENHDMNILYVDFSNLRKYNYKYYHDDVLDTNYNGNLIVESKYNNVKAFKRRIPEFMSNNGDYKISLKTNQLEQNTDNNCVFFEFKRYYFLFNHNRAHENCKNFFEYAKDLGYIPKNVTIHILEKCDAICVYFLKE